MKKIKDMQPYRNVLMDIVSRDFYGFDVKSLHLYFFADYDDVEAGKALDDIMNVIYSDEVVDIGMIFFYALCTYEFISDVLRAMRNYYEHIGESAYLEELLGNPNGN